jgi:predicted nucleic acid-binding protein
VRPVILNNTPLVALWAIDRWSILTQLFGEISIPLAVEREFLAVEADIRRRSLAEASWIHTAALSNPRHALPYQGLDRGEAEVLALAVEQDARLVVIDERKARQFAMRLGLPLTGTMGLLLLAKERGLVSRVMPLIELLQESGFYVAPELSGRVAILANEGES